MFLFGTAGAATWSLGMPNAAGLVSVQFYSQAFVLDPGFNALGAVFSDAAAGIIGM